jgi:SagB-type dehydrogenase family enzyme
VRISLIVRNVEGLAEGVYNYGQSWSGLSLVDAARIPERLQSIYFLNNHNLHQVPVILIVVGKLEAALQTFGARGIRLLNAEAGILAQRAYLSSAELSLGCAAVLGFDAQQIRSIAAIDAAEIPVLLIFIGRSTSKACAYDFRII